MSVRTLAALWEEQVCVYYEMYIYVFMCRTVKNSLNEKGHIGIVEKVQETSSNTGIHDSVCICHYYTA